jgi:hypothetical protein
MYPISITEFGKVEQNFYVSLSVTLLTVGFQCYIRAGESVTPQHQWERILAAAVSLLIDVRIFGLNSCLYFSLLLSVGT